MGCDLIPGPVPGGLLVLDAVENFMNFGGSLLPPFFVQFRF